nr:malonate decarboxylase holo-[acyl-carrier-protein] synthase [uncultured Lichenicoccus sp.]
MQDASPILPQRHDLLQLRPEAWSLLVASDAAMSSLPLLREWVVRGWPVIRRRRMRSDPPQTIPAAIALPLEAAPRRVAFGVPESAVLAWSRPPLLSSVLHTAPDPWSDSVRRLLGIGERHGSEPRVFGSLMWQSVTGLRYLRDGSDLDLLWPTGRVSDVIALLRDIAPIAARGVPPLDGEMLFPGGEAVQWSELLGASRQDGDSVLAKSLDRVHLVRIADLLVRRDAA